jgi:glycosyltransferase involved in cell wall biosynthesis
MRTRDLTRRIEIKRRIHSDLTDQHRLLSRQLRDRLGAERQHLAAVRAGFAEIEQIRRSLYRPMIDALHLARACAEVEAQLKADAYIAHDDVALVAADYMATKHGGRLIYDAVEPFDQEEKTSGAQNPAPPQELIYYGLLGRPGLTRADTRFATSEPLAVLLGQRYGVPFTVLPNYVEAPAAQPSASEIRRQCGCSDTDFLIIYINSVYPVSRFDQIVLAISQCDPTYHLVNVGDIRPQSFSDELHSRIAQSGLQQRIHFLSAVPYHGYLDYISGCDAALVWLDTSNVNCVTNLHNRYLDAVGAGLPILSSENLAFRPINDECNLGLIVPVQAPETLAANMREMRDRRAEFLANMPAAQSALRWSRVEERLIEAVSGCKSVTIVTWKDPRRNQRIQRQVRTLQRHGITVRGIGNLTPDHSNEGGATWFKIPQDIDGDIPVEFDQGAIFGGPSPADDE